MERLPLPTLGWSKNLGSDDDAYGKTVIYKRIDTYFAAIYTGKCDKDGFKVGNVFDNYHYQVAIIMSHKAILACFFLSGLKRCFIFFASQRNHHWWLCPFGYFVSSWMTIKPSFSYAILPSDRFTRIIFAYLQSPRSQGQRQLLYKENTDPRVEILYTYLIAVLVA